MYHFYLVKIHLNRSKIYEMQIVSVKVNIDNLIKNPCKNFLSYLYKKRGWERAILRTSKENWIDSYMEDKQIRILISNTGNIKIHGFCVMDILKGIGFVESEFKYGKIDCYLNSDDMQVKKEFEAVVDLSCWGDYEFESRELKSECGRINMDGNRAMLSFNTLEDGEKLKDVLVEVFNDREDSFELMTGEQYIIGSCLTWAFLKLSGYFN